VSALSQNLKAGRVVRGASTITMQLSRIVSPRKTGFLGKIEEAFNALRLESRLTKSRILELWFNAIPFSFQVEGVQSASRTFFGKEASELTQAQACCLALIPRRPERYNPLLNMEEAISGTMRLSESLSLGLSNEEIRRDVGMASFNPLVDRAPHFSRFVNEQLAVEAQVSTGKGIPLSACTVYTSLDLSLNAFLEERIAYYLKMNSMSRLSNGAAILVDVRTGEILAYVGSRDFHDTENSGEIDGVRVKNQPGSCLKPFLYSLAIEKGFLPNSVLPDIPMDFGAEEAYVPMNFDRRFHGPVRLRVALASSLNVPAVYMVSRLGVNNFTDYLVRLGFLSLESQRGNLGTGIALGNAEVSLFELVQAFSVFPRGGEYLDLSYRKKEKSERGIGTTVMEPYTAAIICSILSDRSSRWLVSEGECIQD
jgi:penicillin-binding protein 1C